MWASKYCECKNKLTEHVRVTKIDSNEEGYRCIECGEFKINQNEKLL